MNLKIRYTEIALFVSIAMSSCQTEINQIQIKPLKNFVWPQNQKLLFEIEPSADGKPMDLLYQVQLNPTYSFQNIWLSYWLMDPTGDTLTASKDNLVLFESSGKPVGIQIKERQFVDAYFLRNIKLTKPGKYHLSLQHSMRQDSLRGVQSIGIRWQESVQD